MSSTKRIVFFGDSITDMERNRGTDSVFGLGNGYPFIVAGELSKGDPTAYEVINRGISGNKIPDLYARVKNDVWNLKPDILGILIGVNDVWHELDLHIGVDLVRFEKVYRMLIEETIKVLPKTRIILAGPFILHGEYTDPHFKEFEQVYDYAAVVKKIAADYKLHFIPLQEKFDAAASKSDPKYYLYDGVHPAIGGAQLIADAFVEVIRKL